MRSPSPKAGIAIATALLPSLASCHPPPSDTATATASDLVSERPREARSVGMCTNEGRVYVLRDNGRVHDASIRDERFGPPLASGAKIVALDCGRLTVCTRDEQGTISCIDDQGQLRPVEGLGPTVALVQDCAITVEGELYCWDEELDADHVGLPKTSREFGELDLNRLHRVVLVPGAGCAVQTSGRLWCWTRGDTDYPLDLGEPHSINDHTEERYYAPHVVAEFTNPTGIEELSLSVRDGVCWRMKGEWSCTNQTRGRFAKPATCETLDCDCTFPCPDSECGTRPCDCRSERVDMRCGFTGELELDERWSVTSMVLHDGECLLDRQGRVWCRPSSWGDEAAPPHEVVLDAGG
ncbi:hypothetical protein DB30_06879 [Enhygromyxa salina]|uniref:Uncharacterized protein n=1 Tax=Enhygromyxa salina TaxID=215803 RepID=A0A0C1Z9Y0_9BACT|nr:hypothetical protein [Enhygromyxa salina]KIG14404.1 hypothetical protein DB30_06879 [Enhygromyxa salina]